MVSQPKTTKVPKIEVWILCGSIISKVRRGCRRERYGERYCSEDAAAKSTGDDG